LSEVRFASASELRPDLHDCGFVPFPEVEFPVSLLAKHQAREIGLI
jgi:hypothetical protein